jgi:hypothetical protein
MDLRRRIVLLVLLFVALAGVLPARADASRGSPAAALIGKYEDIRGRIAQTRANEFRSPIVLESVETSGNLRGDVYAVVAHPFADVFVALRDMTEWCDILMLHLNVKYCRSAQGAGANTLTLFLGRKYFQSLSDAYRLDFAFRTVVATPDYLEVVLRADRGPFDTQDYRVALRAVGLDNARTFIQLSYAYAYGMVARAAMQAYFATFGSDKAGFTIIGKSRDGAPEYVKGIRGGVERNTMRYYLAVEIYLDALSTPPADRLEKRMNDWFDGSERYALQLHEVSRAEYLQMKRDEYRRQRSEAMIE